MLVPTMKPKLPVPDAARFVGLSKSTLDKLRVSGGGPTYLQLGRRILYDLADLEAWLASKRCSSTSDKAAHRRSTHGSSKRRRRRSDKRPV
jgi:predicted DNA-binding transcriptional regulator AlpA